MTPALEFHAVSKIFRARGKTVHAEDLHRLINGLEIPQADKDRLLAMTPASYIGKAAELAKRV